MADTSAFVAGATGYTGRHVVAELLEREIPTVAHVRPDSSRRDEWRERFESQGAGVDTTRWEAQPMATTLARLRPTWVFCLIGTTRKRAKALGTSASEQYDAVDFGLTRLLVEACVASAHAGPGTTRVPRFIYISAAGVSENARGAYMKARWKAEQAIRASGAPYLIARPSFITGADRDESRPGERLGATVTDSLLSVGKLFGAGKLAARYKSMTGEELASALVTLTRRADDDEERGVIVEGEDLKAAL